MATALIALASGYIGSVLHDSFKSVPNTVRAHRFEVADTSGKTMSWWGPDDDAGIPPETAKGVLLVFKDTNGARRCRIGSRIGDYGPGLLFYGKNGPRPTQQHTYAPEPRFLVGLGYGDDPTLLMRGQRSIQVLLGAAHGDAPDPSEDHWGLRFRSRSGGSEANIGVFNSRDAYHAAVMLRNDAGRRWEAAIVSPSNSAPLK